MEAPKIVLVSINEIIIPRGRRSLSVEAIKELAESIEKRTLLHPITVSKKLRLLAGQHRLAACKALGWKKIPVHITNHTGVEAELVEIDENLTRNDLNVLERAEQITRRKHLYEDLYPATVMNKGGRGKTMATVAGVSGFSHDAAKKTGLSERTIREDVQIALKIHSAVRDLIRSTPIANQKRDLLELAREPLPSQMKIGKKLSMGTARTFMEAKTLVLREKRTPSQQDAPLAGDPHCTLLQGDCMKFLPKAVKNKSVHLILGDLPFGGKTDYEWDVKLPLKEFWAECDRVLAPRGNVVMFGMAPFTQRLIAAMPDSFSYYMLVWKKSRVGCIGLISQRVLNEHEDICVFFKGGLAKNSATKGTYNPQGVVAMNRVRRNSNHHSPSLDRHNLTKGTYVQEFTNHPRSILDYPNDRDNNHPTQKPVALLEYLTRTFSNAGETVLDPTMGSGSAGVASLRAGRDFIGIEKDAKFFHVAKKRIRAEIVALKKS